MTDDLHSNQNDSVLPFTGSEYLRSLDDDREVWIYGKRVKNVVEHPAFHNVARVIARMYDALHDPLRKEILTSPTEWENGKQGYTHRFFCAPRTAIELVQQRDAIVEWQRCVWGWVGRSPDYKGSFLALLGTADKSTYGFAENALRWYRKAQQRTYFFAHALAEPPVNRADPTPVDIYVRATKETDAGILVSGAKVAVTNVVLSHYIFVHTGYMEFIVPCNAPGVKMICRSSNEYRAAVAGSPFDYPLSSRFDENDSTVIFDNVFIPWENVLLHHRSPGSYGGGFAERISLHSCTRIAVKMDFIIGLLIRAVELTGANKFTGVQEMIGEILAWRHNFWALSESMVKNATLQNGAFLPEPNCAVAYRVLSATAIPRIRSIIESIVPSALAYVSTADDFKSPELRPYLDQYMRGTDGSSAVERNKIMKCLWDAIGTEFGGRSELYEINHFGSRNLTHTAAFKMVSHDYFKDFAKSALDGYDLDGWTTKDFADK